MTSESRKVTALGLCSGGLDSILAALVLRSQGVHAEWASFETPFFSADKARKAARMTGVPLRVENITETYLEMLKNPRCGYGRHMNPCMDCHALMFRLAGKIMEKEGFDFLFSGEVLQQRPMSQTRPALRYVEKHSGYDGRILRPLSALRLPETLPEKEGLVDRGRLLGISGRSRKDQIALAEAYGVTDYPAPAGGCLLTDKNFSIRLKDLFAHDADLSEPRLHLLKFGRHFRLDDRAVLIIGRDKSDNDDLMSHHDPAREVLIKLKGLPGPVVLLTGDADGKHIRTAAAACAAYGKAPKNAPADVMIKTARATEVVQAVAMDKRRLASYLIGSA